MGALLKKIYETSPALIQNLMVTGYGLKLYRREYGRKFRRALEEFVERQWHTKEQLKEYQEERLRLLVTHAYNNVPYYHEVMKERKLTPDDITTVEDLPRLPVLTREIVRDRLEDLVDKSAKRYKLISGSTNGTTGSPLKLYWDNQVCLMKNVVDWRQKKVAGITIDDKIAFVFGREVVPIRQIKPPFWRHNWIFNHLYFSLYHFSTKTASAYIDELFSFKPRAIEGYPTSLYLLAKSMIDMKRTFPLKAVFCSSEPLLPHQRQIIEKAFDCKLYDCYGMAERAVYAIECEHAGKHLNSDYSIVEILDNDFSAVEIGQTGRIVTTALHSFSMPFIRYRTSDTTALLPDDCSCGRGFPLMKNIAVRDVEIMTTTDGRYIVPAIISGIYDHLTGIRELQFVQEDRKLIVMNLVKSPTYSDSDRQYLLGEMKRIMGDDMELRIKFVDHIPRTAGGKYRWMISKVPLQF
jgi:phenylacetate-CoA ligase